MALIKWNDSFSVGVSSIDNQHKKLCNLVNQLHEAMGAGKGSEAVGKIIIELVTYTQEHFAFEEKFMQSINYPELSKHKILHQNMTQKALELKQSVENNKRINVIQVCSFLKDWLQSHILKEDVKYAKHNQTVTV